MKKIKIYCIIILGDKKDGDLVKKTKKIIIAISISIFLISILTKVYADIEPSDYKPGVITTEEVTSLKDKVGIILGAVRNFSVVVAVISLMVIGLKFIFGSLEEKANYKASLMPYVIGCVVTVAGTTLVSFIYNAIS